MTMITEHPIVFSTEEVAATKALIKNQHIVVVQTDPEGYDASPAIKVGDKLWVQEEHRPVNWHWDDGEVETEYRDGTKRWEHYLTQEEFDNNPNDDYLIAIITELESRQTLPDAIESQKIYDFSIPENLPNWRKAEAMPQFAARLHLTVTNIKTKRVSDLIEHHPQMLASDEQKTLNPNALVSIIDFELTDSY